MEEFLTTFLIPISILGLSAWLWEEEQYGFAVFNFGLFLFLMFTVVATR